MLAGHRITPPPARSLIGNRPVGPSCRLLLSVATKRSKSEMLGLTCPPGGCALYRRTRPVEETRMSVTEMPFTHTTEAEWQTRFDLAACYRLVDLFGWSDLINNRITAPR